MFFSITCGDKLRIFSRVWREVGPSGLRCYFDDCLGPLVPSESIQLVPRAPYKVSLFLLGPLQSITNSAGPLTKSH